MSEVPAAPRSRRSLLKLLGGAAVAAATGAGLSAGKANAADGDQLQVGQTTTATARTRLQTSGALTQTGALVVEAPAADWAVEGTSGQIGVLGNGFVGVMGSGTVGGFFSGDLAAVSLQPQDTTGAPTSGDYSKGDMLVDAGGILYLCVGAGNPGSWIKVSHGGYRPLSAPQRAYDSRQDAAGPLRAGAGDTQTPRTIAVTQAVAAVPASAVAVAGNLAITQAQGSGFATVWPGGAWPETANVNFGAGDISNFFNVGLDGSGSISIASSAQTHVVIDIAGYIL